MGFKNTLRFLAFLCFRMCFFVSIDAQVPIPPKLDGFWYENRPSEADSIFIEAFFDPVCPDSRDSWPGLKQALHHYGSRVTLLVHTFPLPYHDNAFVSSRALHIVNKLNSSATYDLLEAFFQHQVRLIFSSPLLCGLGMATSLLFSVATLLFLALVGSLWHLEFDLFAL
ncbi:uncharacterized protein LOC111388717 [Olea europaea var. sylvestris]|uniref:uncharacterized protein LOC111388717 n=1 Tax=Olea europaea var. sylvestris TaxID=158386 RepID=UPI000C1D4783|nr:uncharacterized protein LOC111388717 [Olea europaea var. sylvestris]